MEFSLDLASRWGGERYNSLNRILKNTFNGRVYKVGLRMDVTWQERLCPARLGVSRKADISSLREESQISDLKLNLASEI